MLSDNRTEYLGNDLSWNLICGVITTCCEWSKSWDGSYLSCFLFALHSTCRLEVFNKGVRPEWTSDSQSSLYEQDGIGSSRGGPDMRHLMVVEGKNSCTELVAQKIKHHCDIDPRLIWDTVLLDIRQYVQSSCNFMPDVFRPHMESESCPKWQNVSTHHLKVISKRGQLHSELLHSLSPFDFYSTADFVCSWFSPS